MDRSHEPPVLLRTADCAVRCGLTARALRIYEMRGLVRPRRDSNGWRAYGVEDISRLNTIALLKKMGLSLSDIRKTLHSSAPSLEQTLDRQLAVWKSRQQKATAAADLVHNALRHLREAKAPSVAILCELVRQFELADVPFDFKVTGKHQLTDRDRSEWARWWRNHSADLTENSRYLQAQKQLMGRLKRRMDRGTDASSRNTAQLITEWESLLLKHSVRERACRQLDWNAPLTTKWYRLGQRESLDKLGPDAPTRNLYSPQLADYIEAAYWASPLGQGLQRILESSAELLLQKAAPSGPRGHALAIEFHALCRRWKLGDPATHARFAAFIEKVNRKAREHGQRESAWNYLRRALSVVGSGDADSHG